MCQRSGAKLLSVNEIDRLFQRANIDTREKEGKQRGGMAENGLLLTQEKVADLALAAIDELNEIGAVEAEAGESELREKLRPLFDQFDEDGSGSVSTDEIGAMAKSLKMEMTKEQLDKLMEEADPDGSGEIEFEELVAVLKKQMREGGGGSMAALFNITPVEDTDGGSG